MWDGDVVDKYEYVYPQVNLPHKTICRIDIKHATTVEYHIKMYPVYLPNAFNEGYGTIPDDEETPITEWMCNADPLTNGQTRVPLYYKGGIQTFGSLLEIEFDENDVVPQVYLVAQEPYRYHIGRLDRRVWNQNDIWDFVANDDFYFTNNPTR